MSQRARMLRRLHHEEEGHAEVGVPALVGAIGAILLTIGAAGDTDVLIWIGGIVLAVGLFVAALARHRFIDYTTWERLDKLEK